MIVDHLKPPYYAVIFTTLMTDDTTDYEATAARMEALAKGQEGYLGMEHARAEVGITISYWKDEAAILRWKEHMEHSKTRDRGRAQWYQQFQLRVCKVEREYGFKK